MGAFFGQASRINQLEKGAIGFDFETDGLYPYQGSKAFIMGFTDEVGTKFSVYTTCLTLPDYEMLKSAFSLFFSNPNLTYCGHNVKFELGFLETQFKTRVLGHIWDTEVMARIEKNSHMRYGLQPCAERIGESKHKPMLEWLKTRGNKEAYAAAPNDIIVPYVEQDAWLSWRLRQHQVEVFEHWDSAGGPKIKPIVHLEKKILPHLFDMERQGILVNVQYCGEALAYERLQIEKAKAQFSKLTGTPFVDSRKVLTPVFDRHGICYGKTALGNASFTEDALTPVKENPLVRILLAHRRAIKRSSAYWSNFIELEENGIIHPSINQNRAQTGRMSISDPSFQNMSTDEEEGTAYPIRRAFVARPDCVIASLDYAQMELRKGADEAEDHPMIERIKAGADLHQEIADIAGVPRSLAKNGRFAKQYGASVPRIAATLGVSPELARTISQAIDEQAKEMAAYSRALARRARPYVVDWLGRRFFFDPGFEYKAFNYVIQGGCAEILKLAILSVGEFLKKEAMTETFMSLVVHDEIVFNLHEKDLRLLPEIKRLMIAAHADKKFLAMDVSVATGPNFHDLERIVV